MKKLLFTTTTLLLFVQVVVAQSNLSLEQFQNPAPDNKPRTWLHAMGSNMSKEGLTKDLEAMERVGIGGIILFNVSIDTPKGDVIYNSPEHHELLTFAAAECERLGLSFGFHNCDGWTSSGGPWIDVDESMKMLTYRQVVVDGGDVDTLLPQPTMREDYYRDVATLAYPALDSDIEDALAKPVITASDPSFDVNLAFDGHDDEATILKDRGGEKCSITIDYGKPFPLRSLFMSTNTKFVDFDLYGSDNGVDYELISAFPVTRVSVSVWCPQGSFDSANKRYYKLVSKSKENKINIREITLSSSKHIDNYLNKNGLGRVDDERLRDTKAFEEGMTIRKDEIIDLTDYIDESGRLTTNLPAGKWTIMRIGQTSTSARNRPASNEGRGLECDKFSREACIKHFDAFSQRVVDNAKKVAPNAMQYIEIDSYEMVGQNWTNGFDEIFKSEKGYDITKLLPIILGKYVEDPYTCEAVLSDFRDVCCDLMVDNYFGAFGEMCRKNDLLFYLEPYTNGPFNYLDAGGTCDIPMGEFWMEGRPIFINEAISSGHIYGKNVISSESFTSGSTVNWSGHPAMAKATGDWVWTQGINEFMFHRFVHQANTHVRPGMVMSRWGFHFDRTQTWWENAGKDWFEYMARGSYMLRQGNPVSDVLTFVGDASPTGAPKGNYGALKSDAVNTDVLLNRIEIKGDKLVLPEGTSYQCLVLRNCDQIEIKTLERLCEIAEAGVPVVGKLPTTTLGYSSEKKDLTHLNSLVERIKRCDNYYKDGDFIRMREVEGIEDDFRVNNINEVVDYSHRNLADGTQIYFFANKKKESQLFECDFRVTGFVPELWSAMDGSIREVDNYQIGDDRTKVNITLDAEESVFVVFKERAEKLSYSNLVETKEVREVLLNEDWSVTFSKDYGYDATVQLPQLVDWIKSGNDEMKYYSGDAAYKKSVSIGKKELKESSSAILDLGEVAIVAEVYVNGKQVDILWIAPFRCDIYDYLKSGENEIEIIVTNQWTNRLIGDERYPDQSDGYVSTNKRMPDWYRNNEPMPSGPRITFSAGKFYDASSPLLPSGLIGPVKITFSEKL